jgi:allantoinase
MDNKGADYALHSTRVLSEGRLRDLTLLIKEGKISEILEGKVEPAGFHLEDLGSLVIMPGLIDSHVHINEPGRTEWEGFETMTKAALAGGITTLVDMPLNASPVTTTKKAFLQKLAATEGKLFCNCGFWGGIVPDNLNQLEELIESGVMGIKAFLTHSGIEDFPNVSLQELRKGMPVLARYKVPLLAHAELDEQHPGIAHFEKNPKSYQAYLASRPKSWEDKAVELLINLSAEFNCRVHIVHLSSADSLPQIEKARASGLHLTVETCPQYLYFCAEEIPDGNTLFKCAPPIREKANNEKLWKALKEETIDFIVTDHSPATPDLKKIESGNLKEAWGGIASIQFSLPAVWTAARKRGFSLKEISALMSSNIASFIGLGESKGQIKKGFDADLVVWDPEGQFVVEEKAILYRHKISPYIGQHLFGQVKQTYLGGVKVYENGKILTGPNGKIILRKN